MTTVERARLRVACIAAQLDPMLDMVAWREAHPGTDAVLAAVDRTADDPAFAIADACTMFGVPVEFWTCGAQLVPHLVDLPAVDVWPSADTLTPEGLARILWIERHVKMGGSLEFFAWVRSHFTEINPYRAFVASLRTGLRGKANTDTACDMFGVTPHYWLLTSIEAAAGIARGQKKIAVVDA